MGKENIDNKNIGEVNLLKKNLIKLYPKLLNINTWNLVKIKKGIYAFTIDGKNILDFNNKNLNKNKVILTIPNLRGINYFKKYCKILGVEEIKNKNGEYIMYKIKGGKKRKLDKYSIEYFEVWENISFLQGRDTILHTLRGDFKETIYKVPNEILNIFIEDKVIRLIDLAIFLAKGNITIKQFKEYRGKLEEELIEQIGEKKFGLLPNNREIVLKTKYGNFKIKTGKVIKDEIEYLHKAGLILEKTYKLAKEKLEEIERLDKEKEIEIEKTKQTLKNLKNEIKKD